MMPRSAKRLDAPLITRTYHIPLSRVHCNVMNPNMFINKVLSKFPSSRMLGTNNSRVLWIITYHVPSCHVANIGLILLVQCIPSSQNTKSSHPTTSLGNMGFYNSPLDSEDGSDHNLCCMVFSSCNIGFHLALRSHTCNLEFNTWNPKNVYI